MKEKQLTNALCVFRFLPPPLMSERFFDETIRESFRPAAFRRFTKALDKAVEGLDLKALAGTLADAIGRVLPAGYHVYAEECLTVIECVRTEVEQGLEPLYPFADVEAYWDLIEDLFSETLRSRCGQLFEVAPEALARGEKLEPAAFGRFLLKASAHVVCQRQVRIRETPLGFAGNLHAPSSYEVYDMDRMQFETRFRPFDDEAKRLEKDISAKNTLPIRRVIEVLSETTPLCSGIRECHTTALQYCAAVMRLAFKTNKVMKEFSELPLSNLTFSQPPTERLIF